MLAHELPDLDPGKGEKLYLIPPTEADYFFGMELSASFTQTASGLDAWGHDIIFEFSGDDDFWLYAKIPVHTEESVDSETGDTVYNTTYKDCVRVMKSSHTELYFFFGDLYNGGGTTPHNFSDYVVKEVYLTGKTDGAAVVLDEEDYVTNLSDFTVTPIENGGTLTVGGTPLYGTHHDGYTYNVSYQIGQSTGHNENIRTDTVTNSRPGIRLFKNDWENHPLAGAVFTLCDNNEQNVGAETYTSSSGGLITIAYLSPGSYDLTETVTPRSYISPDKPLHIVIKQDGTVEASGPEAEFFTVTQSTDDTMAAITLRNPSAELKVIKIDADTNEPLAGVRFALYRQVRDNSGTLRKDYQPMPGFENLLTNTEGILEPITLQALNPGTYYLTETQSAEDYEMIADVCFTIGQDGKVTLSGDSSQLAVLTQAPVVEGKMIITLKVKNSKQQVQRVSILKTDMDNNPITAGASFALYAEKDYDVGSERPKEGAEPLQAGTTGENGLLNFGDLAKGAYYLVETQAPTGYIPLVGAIKIVVNDTVTAWQETSELNVSQVTNEAQNQATWQIPVQNTPGIQLPSTGGPGAMFYTAVGLSLMSIALWMLLHCRREQRH